MLTLMTPRVRRSVFTLLLLLAAATGCSRTHVPAYSEAEELQFRADEAKDLVSPRGLLARLDAIALDGRKRVGSSSEGTDVKLVNWSGAPLEVIPVPKGMQIVQAHEPTQMDGKPLKAGQVIPFAQDGLTGWITNGSTSMHLRRTKGGALLQVFDAKSELIQTFHPLNFYPPSPAYRVVADWVPIAGGHPLTYERTNGGSTLAFTAPGYVRFALNGKPYKLYATLEPDMIYIVFRDLTSKIDTYPAARYLEIPFTSRAFDPAQRFDARKPTRLALDFNQAVNPDCAYSPYTHCPIAPPENRLDVAIPAGEKRYHPTDAP